MEKQTDNKYFRKPEKVPAEAADAAFECWKKYYGNESFILDYPRKTLYEAVEDSAAKFGNEPAVDFEGRIYSFNEFLRKTGEAADAFTAMGIGKGDAVTISLPNVPQALFCFYGLSKIGAVPSMIHPLSSENEIVQYLTLSKSVALVTLDMFFGKNYRAAQKAGEILGRKITTVVTSAADALGLIKAAAVKIAVKKPEELKRVPDGAITWKKFISGGKSAKNGGKTGNKTKITEIKAGSEAVRYGFAEGKREDETAVILYSGGTTGTPKGIMLTDLNLCAEAYQTLAASGETRVPGLRMLSVMPLFHGFGLGIGVHMPLVFGIECVLVPRFSVEGYAKVLKKKKPNFIPGVPTLFEALLRTEKLEKADLSFLKGVYSGGDVLLPELKDRVDAFLKAHGAKVQIREGYGTTECVTASCLTPPSYSRRGSIGIPYPDTYYTVTKPGTVIPAARGEEGEICLRGPSVMKGYINEPEETATALRVHEDGLVWLHTGDLGMMDEEGFVYFRQRLKRVIVTSGYNVYPTQVETVLAGHPAVHLCCVIGVKDDYKMERVKAFVVLKEGYTGSAALSEELRAYCRERMLRLAVPKEIEFRDSLPKTLVGKIDYRALAEEENGK